jgi:transposase-like protein
VQHSINANVQPGVLIVRSLPCSITALLLDGKHLKIKGEPYTLYVAFDGIRKKPLCWILLSRHELRAGYDRILRHFRAHNISVFGVTSDWHRGILAALADHYPNSIHQRCAVHVLQDVMRKLGGQRFCNSIGGTHLWPYVVKVALRYTTLHAAQSRLGTLSIQYPQYRKAWRLLGDTFPGIYRFMKDDMKVIPRHSNSIENFMGQLEQRLKTMKGMKSPEAAIKILTTLILLKEKRSTNK